ncbi:MAG: segregation/condensation protein A [Oscillospiraceae bacterium]|nr:segregation/condensation protein A [Oscillospiraceae bacterium]
METPTFHLEGVIKSKEEMQDFEGPLTLILMLLSKNKIEIRDIKIADILDQYLDWLNQMQRMDLEVASEFVQMASHLVYIKTKTLLAGTEEVSELELLISSLEQLRCRDAFAAVKEVIPALGKSMEAGALLFSTPQEPMPKYGAYDYSHRPWELLAALAGMLQKGVPVPEEESRVPVPRPILYSVRDKSRQLIELLSGRKTASLRELYALAASRSELVATFISLLEMCSMGSVTIDPAEEGEDYLVTFTGGDTEDILESMDYG